MTTYYDKYITREGDRWDLLAYEFYGDGIFTPLLISDNPHLATTPEIPAGSIIYIREELPQQTTYINTQNLPPWRQV